jgi:hypothetical protein
MFAWLLSTCILLTPLRAQEAMPIWENPPKRELPQLSEELRAYVRSKAPLVASTGQGQNGQTSLLVNGRQVPLLVGDIGPYAYKEKEACYNIYAQAGIDPTMLFLDLAYFHKDLGYVGPREYMDSFWQARDSYNKADVEKVLWKILRANPDAQVILWLGVNAYPQWAAENPDELVRNRDGDLLVMDNYPIRYEGKSVQALAKREQYVPSFFSEKYRQDLKKVIHELVSTVDKSEPGRAVWGYLVGGGVDMQLYSVNPPNSVVQKDSSKLWDYSKPAVHAWREWLAKKYGDAASLSKAWGTQVASFEEADPPKDAFPAKGLFLKFPEQRRLYDWKRFLAEGRTDFLRFLSEVIKDASSRPTIVGVAGGDSGARRDLTDVSGLLRVPTIDFLFHQPTYGKRKLPNSGGHNALLHPFQLHRKLFLSDQDHRTWLGEPEVHTAGMGVSWNSDTVGRASDLSELKNMWLRETARLAATGNGAFLRRERSWSFEDPEIVGLMSQLKDFYTDFANIDPKDPQEDLVVIYDEESVDLLNQGLVWGHSLWTTEWCQALQASGVPWRGYYAQDLREGRVPPGKMYFFLNLLRMDSSLADAIEQIRKQGAVTVFFQGTGAYNVEDKVIAQKIGFTNISTHTRTPLGKTSVSESARPNLWVRLKQSVAGLLGSNQGASASVGGRANDAVAETRPLANEKLETPKSAEKENGKWSFLAKVKVVDDGESSIAMEASGAAVLSSYPDGVPASLVTGQPGSTSVFIANPYLSATEINGLAKAAGIWRVGEPGLTVSVGKDFLMLQRLNGQQTTVNLKKPSPLYQYPYGAVHAEVANMHEIPLETGKTYIFRFHSGRE